tara:strand:- start:1709 stop:1897 length:189 start_codon:yes stop_codon:yes gene_type:complete
MLIHMNKKSKYNFSLIWLFQLIASTSWMISVFIYGSYSAGDLFQLLASSAWTIANIINFFKV